MEPELGKLTRNTEADAVHIAVFPATSKFKLNPGERICLDRDFVVVPASMAKDPPIGRQPGSSSEENQKALPASLEVPEEAFENAYVSC